MVQAAGLGGVFATMTCREVPAQLALLAGFAAELADHEISPELGHWRVWCAVLGMVLLERGLQVWEGSSTWLP